MKQELILLVSLYVSFKLYCIIKYSNGKIRNNNSSVHVAVFLSHPAHRVFTAGVSLFLNCDNIVQHHSDSDRASLEGSEVRQRFVFKPEPICV